MVEPAAAKGRLEIMLKAAVQTVRWTYTLFWRLCPQQGVLVWSEGYYNGAIKTRKTVQPTEVTTEEATLQRSQQLRELYESLSAAETQRPCAALSPEDLTESEWFYLMCVSFTFPPGIGLPGKAYANKQHIWLTRAHEADSKLFSRAILAKGARIQTVVCIPLLDGVVELGTTEKVEEDIGLIQRIKSIFSGSENPSPPRPARSENSTSNPSASGAAAFHSPATLPTSAPPVQNGQVGAAEEEDGPESDSDTDRADTMSRPENAEPMQIDMSDQHIRLGSTDDSSNNFDSDLNFHLLAVTPPGNSPERRSSGPGGGLMHEWPLKDPICGSVQPLYPSGIPSTVLAEEDAHYSQTVSNILETQKNRWSKYSSTAMSSTSSAFTRWCAAPATHRHNLLLNVSSQCALKYILFTVPLLHTKARDLTARRAETPQDDLSGSHVLAERRRREKLKERFVVLRSMVPFVTKMDKASILGDTIEYLKQLKKRIQELESRVRGMEAQRRGITSEKERRKMRIVEDGGGRKPKVVESPAVKVEVSIIESDALVEIECLHKQGLLFDAMQVLKELGLHVITVQSSINNGVFAAHLRAKVKDNLNGRKPSIMEVKRKINQLIVH